MGSVVNRQNLAYRAPPVSGLEGEKIVLPRVSGNYQHTDSGGKEIVEFSKARGFLANQLYVIFANAVIGLMAFQMPARGRELSVKATAIG